MTESFTNLYKHGSRLNSISKKLFTEFKKAEEENNTTMMLAYSEAFRKCVMNVVEIAKTVLAVEELIKGKRVSN